MIFTGIGFFLLFQADNASSIVVELLYAFSGLGSLAVAGGLSEKTLRQLEENAGTSGRD